MPENTIDVTGIDLAAFVKDVYDLSNPQGLGFIHFRPEPLSDVETAEILDRCAGDRLLAVCMDYVNGRACKMYVFRTDGGLYILDPWYDHSDSALDELLARHSKKRHTSQAPDDFPLPHTH